MAVGPPGEEENPASNPGFELLKQPVRSRGLEASSPLPSFNLGWLEPAQSRATDSLSCTPCLRHSCLHALAQYLTSQLGDSAQHLEGSQIAASDQGLVASEHVRYPFKVLPSTSRILLAKSRKLTGFCRKVRPGSFCRARPRTRLPRRNKVQRICLSRSFLPAARKRVLSPRRT